MKKLIKKFKCLSRKAKVIISSICIVLVVGTVGLSIWVFSPKPQVDESLYGTKIKLNELPSTEISYPGLFLYSDGTIPVLTKKSFYMEYKANVRFGVKDLSKVEIEETNDTIIFTVPHCEMMKDFIIDEDSIKFTTKDRAIFNWKSIDDVPKAIAQARAKAKEDVNEKFDYAQAIEDADRNIAENLANLFEQTGKTVKVCFK